MKRMVMSSPRRRGPSGLIPAFAGMTVLILLASFAFAMDDDEVLGESGAARKAREAHELAATDMIYQQEEWKALYYQNVQIIELLKDIRNLIQVQNQRAAKTD